MSQKQFYQWFEEIKKQFNELNKWQALGLTMISYGIIKARRAQASIIAEELPEFGKASTVERRVQRWNANPRIEVLAQCVSWMKWVMRNYEGDCFYLLVDETKISDRIGCMMISLAVHNRAIPLIWRCYRANSAIDYPSEGQVKMIGQLLCAALAVIPKTKNAVLEADRGIGNSSNMMREVSDSEGNFLFRVTQAAIFTSKEGRSTPLKELAVPGEEWHGTGTLFTKHRQVECEVHIHWEDGQEEPWCLATNLSGLTGKEYAIRVWQEESFRDLKSGGWQWQVSLIRNPEIVERLLLPMALAYAWCVSLGLLFLEQDTETQLLVDCVREHIKYCVFRMGLRFFKRYLFLDPSKLALIIGPFPAPT
jgi:hypothetical protein